jgi:hypothetical protein
MMNSPNIAHRQRLIFATDSLRKLLLYHTLFQRQSDHSDRQKKNDKQKQPPTSHHQSSSSRTRTTYAHLSHDEIALGLDAFNPYGIVNTRILFPSNHTTNTNMNANQYIQQHMTGNGRVASSAVSSGHNVETFQQGMNTETIYNPTGSSMGGTGTGTSTGTSATSATISSSLFNIHHDLIQDQNDAGQNNVSVILYFILPLPDHVKAVSKIIQSYTHQYTTTTTTPSSSSTYPTSHSPSGRRGRNNQTTNNPFDNGPTVGPTTIHNTKIKHRIIFLSRCTKLCIQILYNENILPSPEYNNDNIVLHKKLSSTTVPPTTTTLVNLQKNTVIHTLDIDLIPIEDDILTLLDSSSVMKDISSIHGIPSSHVNSVASSIMKIQTIANGSLLFGNGGTNDGQIVVNGENDNDHGDDGMNHQGYIPRIQSFGRISESIVKRCFDLRREEFYESCMISSSNKSDVDNHHHHSNKNHNVNHQGDIHALMILDRRVDLVTPLLTPLTYEGLLDDVLSIESGILHVKTDVINPPEDEIDNEQSKTSKSSRKGSTTNTNNPKEKPIYTLLPLNDQDTLYVEVRDQHVEKFGSFLQEQAKALKESHANFSNKDKDLTEIHQFVKQIPIFTQNLKSLTHHIHLAELIKHTTIQSEFRQRWQLERSIVESESCLDVIEDLIASQYNVWRVLRLLCLHSITNGGIKTSKLDMFKREVVQTYGYEFVFLLQNLESIGLLRKKDTLWDTAASSAYGTLRKQLQLIQPDVDPLDPDDVSYVSSGYAPISARIIQTSMKGWGGKEEALKELSGRRIDVEQHYPPEEFATSVKHKVGLSLGEYAKKIKHNQNGRSGNKSEKKKPILLVYFVGGITYAEIAALRFMSKRSSFPYQIVCCTTKIINGTSLLQSLV